MRFFHQDNCVEVTSKLLSLTDVKLTSSTLKDDITFHPDYPSLLCISDTLLKYGVNNISVKISFDNLQYLSLPCIVHLNGFQTIDSPFSIIKSIDSSNLIYYHPVKLKWIKISLKDFAALWTTGIALFIDAANARGEKDYIEIKHKEQRAKIQKYSIILATPALACILMCTALLQNGAAAIIPLLYLIFSFLGVLIGVALAWYDIDQNNLVLHQICSAGKNMNCSAVTNSKASKILGISWSTIGLIYFTTCFYIQILVGLYDPVSLGILAWLNMLAAPFVFFSVYYQWRVAKQWCLLCLSILSILMLQFFTALLNDWHTIIKFKETITVINLVLISCTISFIIINLLLFVLRLMHNGRTYFAELQRLKHNSQIFQALLERQKKINTDPAELGILLGNPHGSYKIIKVCNPYCDPCAKAHLPIDELLESNHDVQVQIIFTADNIDGDIRAKTVKHLLTIAEGNSERFVKNALDEWYLAKSKDYKLFAKKFPLSSELKQQDAKVEAMSRWCNDNDVMFTPTFFVNGYQLPEIYAVGDLKNLIPPLNPN